MLRRIVVVMALVVWTLPLVAGEKSRQQSLSELLALIDRADEIVVYSEGFRRESVIYRSTERRDFEDLKRAITLRLKGGPFQCACVDGPEIALVKNKKEIGSVWNHEGTAIGSSVWGGDWESSDSNRWLNWFDARGIKGPRKVFDEVQAQNEKSKNDEVRWLNAMPSSIRPLWAKASQYDPVAIQPPDIGPLSRALSKQYPNTEDRIRALLSWYGSGAGPWSGFPGYELIAEKLLREHPNSEIIKAIENRKLTDEETEGAARILGGWTPVPDRTPIPAELQRLLLEHCLKSTDEDKVERAKKAFAPSSPS